MPAATVPAITTHQNQPQPSNRPTVAHVHARPSPTANADGHRISRRTRSPLATLALRVSDGFADGYGNRTRHGHRISRRTRSPLATLALRVSDGFADGYGNRTRHGHRISRRTRAPLATLALRVSDGFADG